MYIDSLYKSMTCVNIKYRKRQFFTTLNGFKLSKNLNSCSSYIKTNSFLRNMQFHFDELL